eukprot:gene15394-20761_t
MNTRSKSKLRSFTEGGVVLLLIDPQVDFHGGGSLAVAGADEDSHRISQMVEHNIDKIDEVIVTLDSHNPDHIAHALFWSGKIDGTGIEPSPFSQISSEDLLKGKWFPKDMQQMDHCIEYTRELEKKGRFMLTIWPPHCLIGSAGQKIFPPLAHSLEIWKEKRLRDIVLVHKGMNNLTEMYSAIEAEVPLPFDVQTFKNAPLVEKLKHARKLIIGGQALSHCVNYTCRDILKYWDAKNPADIILLTD